jgi:hypothetical protein
MCVGVPAGQAPRKLSAHFRIWLDAPLAHLEARELLERLCKFAWLRLRELRVEPADDPHLDQIVDWKVAEPQQPLYLATPSFEGIEDPFPGSLRRGLHEGGDEFVRLAVLEGELDAAGVRHAAAVRNGTAAGRKTPAIRRKAPTQGKPPVPRSALPAVPTGSADVVPIAAGRRLAKAYDIRVEGRLYRRLADRGIFAARAPLEVVRLVGGRVAAGATDRRWRSWHEAGGVPEGLRDRVLFLVGCLVAESLPAGELTDMRVNGAILEIGRLIIGREWLEGSWIPERLSATLVARAVAAGRGETELWRGELKDVRYRVGKARLLRELAVQPDEAARYGLVSLASDRDRLAAKRLAQGATPRAKVQAANREKARQALALITGGSSQRAAAAAVGLDEKQLRRILKAKECSGGPNVAAIPAGPEPAARGTERSLFVPHSADSSSTSRVVRREKDSAPIVDPRQVTPPPGSWAALKETYAALTAAARVPGADGSVVVSTLPSGAPSNVRDAYRVALEAVADARRRAKMRYSRRHGPAAAVKAWYDVLAALPIEEALARVRARRQELAEAQRVEHAATAGFGERALRNLKLRHLNSRAIENRHAARILGSAWAQGRRVHARAESNFAALRGPGTSAKWRKAMRTAEGLAQLSTEERNLVLAARTAAARGKDERDDLRLLQRAITVVLERRHR